jgi:hypothetical protein
MIGYFYLLEKPKTGLFIESHISSSNLSKIIPKHSGTDKTRRLGLTTVKLYVF